MTCSTGTIEAMTSEGMLSYAAVSAQLTGTLFGTVHIAFVLIVRYQIIPLR